MNRTLRCSSCQEEKPEGAFARNRARATGRQNQCRSCHAEVQRRRYEANARRWTAIKLARGCEFCGVRPTDPGTLHWDHIDPATKWTESGAYSAHTTKGAFQVNWSWARIERELAKCRVLCASCHGKRTWAQRQGLDPFPLGGVQ